MLGTGRPAGMAWSRLRGSAFTLGRLLGRGPEGARLGHGSQVARGASLMWPGARVGGARWAGSQAWSRNTSGRGHQSGGWAQHVNQERTVSGTVSKVFYRNHKGWTVFSIAARGQQPTLRVSGSFDEALHPGMEVSVKGVIFQHEQYGIQMKNAEPLQVAMPTDAGQITEYLLHSKKIKGLGVKRVEAIRAHFGDALPAVMEEDATRLTEVRGISKSMANNISEAWTEERYARSVTSRLRSTGLPYKVASALVAAYDLYGLGAKEQDLFVQSLKRDPWATLMSWSKDERRHWPFQRVDEYAMAVTPDPHHTSRFLLALQDTLYAAARSGHTRDSDKNVTWHISRLLRQERGVVEENLGHFRGGMEERALSHSEVARWAPNSIPNVVYDSESKDWSLGALLWSEVVIAQQMIKRCHGPALPKEALPTTTVLIPSDAGAGVMELSDAQVDIVRLAVEHNVLVVTGGPGVGKSSAVRAVVAQWRRMGLSVGLACPTGRAAQTLSKMTGHDVKTLHKMLQERKEMPDALVVDEMSMAPLEVLAQVLSQCTKPTTKLLLVGDPDQLPAVGPGQVLRDIIRCGDVPVATLNEVFRQAAQSSIVSAAHMIIKGESPAALIRPFGSGESDLEMLVENNTANIPDSVCRVVEALMEEGYSSEDIQVLTPMRKGSVGSRALNDVLRPRINAKLDQLPRHPVPKFVAGDRVIQNVNNYDIISGGGVFNGSIGQVEEVHPSTGHAQSVTVAFDHGSATYDADTMDEIELAYAITIHKSQGSEYPVVIIPLVSDHSFMLNRSLVYTGMTRAKRRLVLVGTNRVLQNAINRIDSMHRRTRLGESPVGPGLAAISY